MSIRRAALEWLRKQHPADAEGEVRTSKFYPERELWFLTLPSEWFDG